MKPTKHGARKDLGDLKKEVIDTANTAKEIAQDKLYDVKAAIKNRVKLAEENKKHSQKMRNVYQAKTKKGSVRERKR